MPSREAVLVMKIDSGRNVDRADRSARDDHRHNAQRDREQCRGE
jgi:hypothetical protein